MKKRMGRPRDRQGLDTPEGNYNTNPFSKVFLKKIF